MGVMVDDSRVADTHRVHIGIDSRVSLPKAVRRRRVGPDKRWDIAHQAPVLLDGEAVGHTGEEVAHRSFEADFFGPA